LFSYGHTSTSAYGRISINVRSCGLPSSLPTFIMHPVTLKSVDVPII